MSLHEYSLNSRVFVKTTTSKHEDKSDTLVINNAPPNGLNEDASSKMMTFTPIEEVPFSLVPLLIANYN